MDSRFSPNPINDSAVSLGPSLLNHCADEIKKIGLADQYFKMWCDDWNMGSSSYTFAFGIYCPCTMDLKNMLLASGWDVLGILVICFCKCNLGGHPVLIPRQVHSVVSISRIKGETDIFINVSGMPVFGRSRENTTFLLHVSSE